MPAILNTAPIGNAEAERKAQELIYAFYRFYWGGVARTLAGEQVTFPAIPKENYLFNQQESKPLESGGQIHTIFTDLRPTQVGDSSLTKKVEVNAIFTIYLRVWNPSSGMQSAEFECRARADELRRMIESGTQALAQLGMHHMKIRRGPVAIPVPGVQTRMIVATARMEYAVGY